MTQIVLDEREQIHARINRQMKELFQIEDMSGVELMTTLGRVFQLGEILDSQRFDIPDVSLPRWRLLLHLFIAEQLGNTAGLTPTEMSDFRQVSKNTVSSLLRGLEEQGLIQRTIDAKDLRLFRIHLTGAGRQLIIGSAPQRINGLNQLVSGLEREEQEQLTYLLNKLRKSLERQVCQPQKEEKS